MMKFTRIAALGALAITAAVVATPSMAAGKCVMAGGEATMATQDLAKFMAEAALKNSISGMGAKPAGKIAMQCDTANVLPHCVAKQRACK